MRDHEFTPPQFPQAVRPVPWWVPVMAAAAFLLLLSAAFSFASERAPLAPCDEWAADAFDTDAAYWADHPHCKE